MYKSFISATVTAQSSKHFPLPLHTLSNTLSPSEGNAVSALYILQVGGA